MRGMCKDDYKPFMNSRMNNGIVALASAQAI